ncbi:MAG: enoyl-CoA hydratase/isomerase family protein [Chrysiogenales bacterium]|nr:MAG: enoyl-CoA hydratase/isomerase family protein [Chrysiogenales bacterium]
MSIVSWSKDENVALLSMNNGENRQNLEFATTMAAAIDEITADPSIVALVLTSSDEKNFSQGVDVAWMAPLFQKKDFQPIKDFMYTMNDIFKKLMLLPMPTIAAINGHAYGNGAILSCACDYRFMRADRGFFCFPEVNVGIPLLHGMNAFVKKAIPLYKLVEMQFSGNRYGAPELEQHHIIIKACADRDELMKESLAFARTFQKKRGILGEMKKRMYRDIIEIMDSMDAKVSIEPVFLMITD